ncbi:MAG: 50S ribosomal protein L11 [Candidatus Hepatoplasma crinochetorum]|nr:MAG: 50S ribosomal protein L11 [Candidatus Hepatoplasma crinochetorum]
MLLRLLLNSFIFNKTLVRKNLLGETKVNFWKVRIKEMAKKLTRVAKLQFPAGQAKPGPSLAGLGIDMVGFTRSFNDATKDRNGDIVPVIIKAYSDRSFEFELKTTPTSVMIKKALGIKSGSQKSKKEIVGKLTIDQIKEIAKYKMQDLNTKDLKAAMRMVIGTAKNMGVDVETEKDGENK